MIGHAMPAAGMAGLIKTALALYHRVLPPTLHAEKPQPLLADAASPFASIPAARPWIHADEETPRRAGVNAFGFAGINAHAVLEEHTPSADGDRPGALRAWETEAILFSAPDRAGLIEQVRELLSWLERQSRALACWTSPTRSISVREHPPAGARLGLVASRSPSWPSASRRSCRGWRDPTCRSIRDGRGVYLLGRAALERRPAGAWRSSSPARARNIRACSPISASTFPRCASCSTPPTGSPATWARPSPPSEHLFGPVPGRR